MPETKKARMVGFNHIALEVGDIEEGLPSKSLTPRHIYRLKLPFFAHSKMF